MRLVMVLNALGLLASTGYAAMVLTRSYTPLWAFIAAALFFFGIFQPVLVEYALLGGGFKKLEGGYTQNRRRERGEGPKVEIIGPDQPPGTAFRQRGPRNRTPFLLFVVGFVLLCIDGGLWWTERPPPPKDPGVITNF